jgi:hypothetical protein
MEEPARRIPVLGDLRPRISSKVGVDKANGLHKIGVNKLYAGL